MRNHILRATILLIASCGIASAQDAPSAYELFEASPEYLKFALSNLWLLIATAMVFIMHLGFATLESGLCQSKNVVNILFKNCFIIAMGLITYYLVGFNTHYPGDLSADPTLWNGYLSIGGPAGAELGSDAFTADYNANYNYWTDFVFQGMFAATAATIVSGAVAERAKLLSFLLFATLLVAFAYPIAGSWHWGTGFLSKLGFYDFAGSTVVHAFGGFAALACIMILGPRIGKYSKNGIKPILPHNLPLASIGVFLLIFGWFGFNGGSVLSADAQSLSYVFVTTALAACTGAVGSMISSSLILKKPDLSMALNGFLAGLVGITAGADAISVPLSMLTGFIAGIIVVLSILGLDRLKLDDPVGAVSVHGVCGIWGTLAVGIFSDKASVGTQALGILCVCAFSFIFSFIVYMILKMTLGVRVDEEEEHEGLDVAEHGAPAYNHDRA